jgi:hypothetical protein
MPRFGTLLSLLLLLGSFAPTATRPAAAAVKEFPYEAVIEADEAYVRCGPGKNYYTTMKLTRGQRVTVRRHDPGGWFMIDPPAGSFSLIRMEDVVQQGNLATVKRLELGQATVRIGSSLDPTADAIFQRKLSSGERVEILGEVLIPRKDRQVSMFRIRPPRGEFRWIEGNDVTPLDPTIRQQQDSDPFSTPPSTREARRDPSRESSATTTHLTASIGAQPAPQAGLPTPKRTVPAQKTGSAVAQQVVIGPASFDPRGRLDQIDTQFRDMIQKEPPAWNLPQIEQAYLELRQNPAAAGVSGQVDLRFSALSHYKQVKSQYDDYYRLVSGTTQRDAELAAVENSLAPQNSRPAVGPTPTGAWPTNAPQGDSNYQMPAPGSAAPPTQHVPNYSPQFSPAPSYATQSAASPPHVSPQPPTERAISAQLHNGLTLGAPVPMPGDNGPPMNPPSQRPASDLANSPPNAGPPGQSAVAPANPPNRQTAPLGSVPTEPGGSDLGIGPFAGEIGPGQTPAPPRQGSTKHPSQFAPNATGESPAQATAPTSPPATLPGAPNTGFNPTLGQSTPASPMGASGPMPNQPYPPPPQNQTQFLQHPAGENPIPLPSQQPATQRASPSQGPPQQPGPLQLNPQTGQPNAQPGGPPSPGNAMPALSPPRQIRPPGSPPLDGAGIVQRAATTFPNGPSHVLLAPNGRILAYLQPDRGVNLDPYVGRQMGIMGLRAFQPELQTDLIVVRGLIPVRLVQP